MKDNLINIADYFAVPLLDCDTVLLLNKKHTVQEFQEEVNKAKEKAKEDIAKYGDAWEYIQMNMSKDFDYIELCVNKENVIVF